MTMPGEPDEALLALRRAVLRKLATGAAGTRWQEVASETLHERYSLREAAVSGAYRDLFEDSVESIHDHEKRVGKSRFDADGRGAARILGELREQLRLDEERRERERG
jgi:hypothetical protein